MSTIVVLDNIRSAQNVGAIFRTSDGAGVEKIILAGYTPAPIDRFGRTQPAIAKTSLGATESVAWESCTNEELVDRLQTYRTQGYQLVAVEQGAGSVSLYDFIEPEQVVYIFGNEVDGVSPDILSIADTLLELPMRGMKESLNVSVTAGIVLYHTGK